MNFESASAPEAGSPPVEIAPLALPGRAHPMCRAIVTIPVRNEEATLGACLEALAGQVDLAGSPLPPESFEVLLLCNNCTDRSAALALQFQARNPALRLCVAERELPPVSAHAGTARRLLMEAAFARFDGGGRPGTLALLCTDADSAVAPDWIAQNVQALEQGADSVGGRIVIREEELARLPAAVLQCYRWDRQYAAAVARLEDSLDPQPGDPLPRHLDHFGSSLACTPAAYARAGGMPAAPVLEDEAFVDRLRRANLCLRHAPEVRVYTSARLEGRAATGLAGQLRLWADPGCVGGQTVLSGRFLEHRFRTLRRLRQVFRTGSDEVLGPLPPGWPERVHRALAEASNLPEFLTALDCNRLIEDTFPGAREQKVQDAIRELDAILAEGTAAC